MWAEAARRTCSRSSPTGASSSAAPWRSSRQIMPVEIDRPSRSEGQLPDGPLAEAVGPGKDAEDRPQAGPEGPGGHARRQLRSGGGAASGAGQAMEPILVHHREDRRQLGDLMPERLGIIAGEGVAAPAALRRLALDDLADCLGRDQGAGMTSMAGLAAPLLARGGGRGPSLDRGRDRRRGAWRSWWSCGGPAPGVRRPAARRSLPAPRRPLGPRARGCPRWVVRAAADRACRRSTAATPRKQDWAVNAYPAGRSPRSNRPRVSGQSSWPSATTAAHSPRRPGAIASSSGTWRWFMIV